MNVDIVLYDDFETMDAFCLAEVFGSASDIFHVNYVSLLGDIVNSSHGVKVWTELLEPEKIRDVLVIPGGRGSRRIVQQDDMLQTIRRAAEQCAICLSVGAGTVLLARTGMLYHRNAVLRKLEKNWTNWVSSGVNWIQDLRWIEDGKYYTAVDALSSIDMGIDFIASQYDMELALQIARQIGYEWDPDKCGEY